MPNLTYFVLAFIVVGLSITLGVWLFVRLKLGASRTNLNNRGSMQVNDWLNAFVNVIVGVFLGLAIAGLGQLITTALWPIAILIPILFGGFLLFDGLISGLVDKVFPSGIRPARKPAVRRFTPLPRLLSLPVGIIFGVALAWLGLGDRLFGIFY